MKISYADYIKKSDVSVLVAEAIFHDLNKKYPNKKIEDVADTTSGGTPLRGNHDYYGGNIPWLKSGELNDGFIDKAEEYITEKGLANSSAKLHPEGTLLIAMYGATVGKTAITKIKTATNQAICAVFPKPCIDRDYLFWFFKAHRYKYIEMSKGGAQPNISQTVILKTPLPVPEIVVQKKIISILERVGTSNDLDLSLIPDEYRTTVSKVFSSKNNVTSLEAELNNQNGLLTQLRQSFLREAMQGKLVKQDPKDGHAKDLLEKIKAEKAKSGKKEKELPPIKPEEIPFEIPENWVWCRLGEICSKITDGFHNTPPKVVEGYPYIAATHVKSDKIDWESCNYVSEKYHRELYTKAFPQKGELLVVNIGAGCGTPAIIDVDFEFSFKNTAILKFNQRLVSNKLLFYYFLSRKEEIYAELTKGGLQPFLSLKILNEIEFPLPPFLEQIRIVKKADEVMKLCDELQESIQASREQNELLLQQVLKEALNG